MQVNQISVKLLTSDYATCCGTIFSGLEQESKIGYSCSPVPGLTVRLEDVVSAKGIHDTAPSFMLELILTLSGGIATNMVSSWLYDICKRNNIKKAVLDQTEVSVDIRNIDNALIIIISHIKRT